MLRDSRDLPKENGGFQLNLRVRKSRSFPIIDFIDSSSHSRILISGENDSSDNNRLRGKSRVINLQSNREKINFVEAGNASRKTENKNLNSVVKINVSIYLHRRCYKKRLENMQQRSSHEARIYGRA